MAILTQLPFDAARELLSAYDFRLLELQPLVAGSVNSNFFVRVQEVDGAERQLFARIYEEQVGAGAEFELRLNQALSQAAIPVARPVVARSGRLYCEYQGKPFAVYERLSGEITCQKQVNASRCYSLGRALAQVHLAPLSGLVLQPSRFGFEQIKQRLVTVIASARPSLVPAARELQVECERLEKQRDLSLPAGLIHGDLFRDNVLLRDDQVTGLLDFESASLGMYAYDLMVTILAWCFGDELEPDLVAAVLAGYTSLRPLTPKERSALVLEGEVVCLRFATTRLTDFSLRVAEGQTPTRDYRRFLARKAELRSPAIERLFTQA